MLQNASYMFFLKKQNKTKRLRKKELSINRQESNPRPSTCIIYCATQPLLGVYDKLIVFFCARRDKLFKMAQKMQTYDEMSTTKGHS